MPVPPRVLRVSASAVAALLATGACNKRPPSPPSDPPVEPPSATEGAEPVAPAGVELHYAKSLKRLRTEVVAVFSASQYHEDVEAKIAFAAEVEIDEDGRDLTLKWRVLSVDTEQSESSWGALDPLIGAEGSVAMGPRGQDPKPSPVPSGFAGKGEAGKARLYETVSGAFRLPVLSAARLEVGKPVVETRSETFAIGGAKVPIAVEITYQLRSIETVDGIELATLEISGSAVGEMEHESIVASVDQTTEAKLVLGLADGVPRSFGVVHEQSVSYGDEDTGYKYSVDVKFTAHE